MVTQGKLRFSAIGVAAILTLGACSNPVGGGEHRTMRDVVITTAEGDTLARTQGNQTWIGAPLALEENEARDIRIFFIAMDGTPFQLPSTGAAYTLHVSSEQPAVARYEPVSATQGRLVAGNAGAATLRVHLWHGVHPAGHADADSPALPVTVQ